MKLFRDWVNLRESMENQEDKHITLTDLRNACEEIARKDKKALIAMNTPKFLSALGNGSFSPEMKNAIIEGDASTFMELFHKEFPNPDDYPSPYR